MASGEYLCRLPRTTAKGHSPIAPILAGLRRGGGEDYLMAKMCEGPLRVQNLLNVFFLSLIKMPMALKGGEEAIEMRMEGGLITSQMDGGKGLA